MRFLMLPAVLGAAAIAMPAFAAGTGSTSNTGQTQTKAQSQQTQAQGQMQQGQMQQGKSGSSSQAQAMSQDKLRSSLEKAGFTNVTVLDAAYLVRAQSEDGDTVMMFINPPPQTSASAADMSGTGSQSGAKSGQQNKSGSSTTTQ